MSILNRTHRVVTFDDAEVNSNPLKRYVDWRRDVQAVPVENPSGATKYLIDPQTELSIFNGSRSLTVDSTTELVLAPNILDSSQYRLYWDGNGTAPGFRTERALSLTSGTLSLVLQSNNVMVATHTGGSVFGSVQVGDIAFIPGVTTGDPSLFNVLNEGEWVVIAASASALTLTRAPGSVFQGASDSKTITTATQFMVYAPTGVRVGDTLDIISAFSVQARNSYRVVAVTSRWVDFFSGVALASQTLLPGASSFAIYGSAKRYLYLETDQPIAMKLNGNTTETDRVDPFLAGDPDRRGPCEKWGLTFSLSIKNRSTAPCTVIVITAE